MVKEKIKNKFDVTNKKRNKKENLMQEVNTCFNNIIDNSLEMEDRLENLDNIALKMGKKGQVSEGKLRELKIILERCKKLNENNLENLHEMGLKSSELCELFDIKIHRRREE